MENSIKKQTKTTKNCPRLKQIFRINSVIQATTIFFCLIVFKVCMSLHSYNLALISLKLLLHSVF